MGSGGGIYNTGSVSIASSMLHDNQATYGDGGAIANDHFGPSLQITSGTVIEKNTAQNGGGIVTIGYTPVTITGSTVRLNSAGTNGGGISTGAPLTVTASTISRN